MDWRSDTGVSLRQGVGRLGTTSDISAEMSTPLTGHDELPTKVDVFDLRLDGVVVGGNRELAENG